MRLLLVVAAVCVAACASKNHIAAIPSSECPVVLLSRTGGLGFESQAGLLAAVWSTGTIIRSESGAFAGPRHLIGTVSAADLAALIELTQSPAVWDSSRGDVALDSPDDTLTLRKQNDVRQWSETPGFTTTPAVSQLRSRLFSLPVAGAKRLTGPFDDVLKCAAPTK